MHSILAFNDGSGPSDEFRAINGLKDWTVRELNNVYGCIDDMAAKEDADDFAKEVGQAMEASKTKLDDLEENKDVIDDQLNNAWSYLFGNSNYEPDVADVQKLNYLLPTFKELSTFYAVNLGLYLERAREYANETHEGWDELPGGCGGPNRCSEDFHEILREEKERLESSILPWIKAVRNKLDDTYSDWEYVCAYAEYSCSQKRNAYRAELKAWKRDFNKIYVSPLVDLKQYLNTLYSIKYIGCYKDKPSRAMRYGPKKWHYTAKTCSAACKDYKYFSLQAGSWCSCENDLLHATKYGKASNCRDRRGGGWANDIFQFDRE